jgi:hypothetical protein
MSSSSYFYKYVGVKYLVELSRQMLSLGTDSRICKLVVIQTS